MKGECCGQRLRTMADTPTYFMRECVGACGRVYRQKKRRAEMRTAKFKHDEFLKALDRFEGAAIDRYRSLQRSGANIAVGIREDIAYKEHKEALLAIIGIKP